MQSKLILLLGVLFFTACSKAPVGELTVSGDSGAIETTALSHAQSDSDSHEATAAKALTENSIETAAKTPGELDVASDPATESSEAEKSNPPSPEEIAAAALAKRVETAQSQLADLDSQYAAAYKTWLTDYRSAKTPEARQAMLLESPNIEFGKKYIALADKFSGTPAASTSLRNAMKRGTSETKQIAASRLFKLAQADPGTLESEKLLFSITMIGDQETKQNASLALADIVVKDPLLLSEAAQRIAPRLLGFKPKLAGKEPVANVLINHADQDIRSNKSLDSLVMVASATSGKTKTAALSRISEHHLQSDKIYDVIKKVSAGRVPDEAAEIWLKEICRKSSDAALKTSAAIALKSVIDRRNSIREKLVDADEETRSKLDPQMLAYLDRTPEPGEMEMIETTLTEYVSGSEALLKTAQNELFVLQNLSVGKVAPDIVATDVDGVEFKLSEYRGKVVFIDFWGDW